MNDLIKIMVFGLVSFIIGHTATEKLSNEQVASYTIDSLKNIYRLQLYKENDLEKLDDSLIVNVDGFRNPFFISKSDSNDNLIWIRNVGGSPFELPNRIFTGPGNTFYLIGTVGNQFAFNQNNGNGFDQTMSYTAFLVKFDSNGKELWANFVPGLDVYRYYKFFHINEQPVIEGFYDGFLYRRTIWSNSNIYWRE